MSDTKKIEARATHCGSALCDGLNDVRVPSADSERPFCNCDCAGCTAVPASRAPESGVGCKTHDSLLKPGLGVATGGNLR